MAEAPPTNVPANLTQPPPTPRPTAKVVDRTYHPKGYGMSPSLRRARAPYFLRNSLVGTTLALFVGGIYVYSISAVSQDDFSDVEDLLPPLAERSKYRSIEDEARDTTNLHEVTSVLPSSRSADTPVPFSTSTGSSLSKALPGAGEGSDVRAAAEGSDMRAAREGVDERAGGERERWWGGRLSEVDWVRRVVGVEEGTGNLVVWGAPDVDHMGRVGDGGLPRRTGPRVV